MPVHPPAAVFDALRAASLRSGIPLTLLMAIAKVESNFDPKAEGKPTNAGWKAQGLMQLAPATASRLGVTDRFDAKQSALGGATLLAELGLATDNNIRRMLAGYYWGATRSEAWPQKQPYPPDIERYIKQVMGVRAYYENLATPKGATASERLANAITGLRELNPGWRTAEKLAADWTEANKGGAITNAPDEHNLGLLADFWGRYAKAFPDAPITDGRTPPPWRLNPDIWPKVARFVDDKAKMVIDVVADAENYAKDLGEKAAFGAGAGLAAAGAVWLLLSARRRRNA